jgi:hypothetical protein
MRKTYPYWDEGIDERGLLKTQEMPILEVLDIGNG